MKEGSNGKAAVEALEMGCPVVARPSECSVIQIALNAIRADIRGVREEHGAALKAIRDDVSRIKGKLNMKRSR